MTGTVMYQYDSRPVLGLGELLWDCFPDGRMPGGAPANVAFHCGQLGLNGQVVSRVGQDAEGHELIEFLSGCAIGVEQVQRDAEYPTGKVTVEIAAGEPVYTIHEPAAWDYLAFDDILVETATNAKAICFGTLAQRGQVSRETIRRILAVAPEDCLRICDLNLRAPWFDKKVVEDSLSLAHVVKLNESEVAVLSDMLEVGISEPRQFGLKLQSIFSVETVCITRGAHGCWLMRGHQTVDSLGIPVDIVDTVGAGDAFSAAMTFGLIHQWPLINIAEFSNRMGAFVASRRGAMPELSAELREFSKSFEN